MTYVPFGGNGDNIAPEWGLFQFQPGKWRLAFCLGEYLKGWDVLFEPQEIGRNGNKVTLSVLKLLDIDGPEDYQPADKWQEVSINQTVQFGDKHPGIRINNSKLSIKNKTLGLELPIRLELSESTGFSMGTLSAVADTGKGATFKLDEKELAFPNGELRIPFKELSLGPLLRIHPRTQTVNQEIIIRLKEKTMTFPPLDVEVNLVCPMGGPKNNLLLQLPT